MYDYLLYTLITLIITTSLYLIKQNYSSSVEPPVVRSFIPFLGSAIEFGKNAPLFLATQRARFGDYFVAVIGGTRMIFVLDHTSWESIFFKHKPTLSFEPFKKMAMIGGFGARSEVANIPEVEKQAHGQYIKYLQTSGLDTLSKTINEHLLVWFKKDQQRFQDNGEKVIHSHLYDLIQHAGFGAGIATVFGSSFMEGDPDILTKFKTFDSKFAMLLGGAPAFAVKDAVKARADLQEYIHKQEWDGTESDLMKARTEMFAGQPQMSKLDVAKSNLAILWASQSNTLPALFWFVWYVWRDPIALAAVRTEIETVLEKYDAKNSLMISREALKEMIVLDSCFNETLRLCTGSLTVRSATENSSFSLPSGYTLHVRKGDTIALFPFLHHHDPVIFKNPNEFKWDRFMPVDGKPAAFYTADGEKVKFPLVPFGGGVSMCPGRFFVTNETKVLAVLMLQLLEFQMDPNQSTPPQDETRCGLGIIPPKHDVPITYKYRA